MKSQKALPTITRKILVIIFNVLQTGQPFDVNRNLQVVIDKYHKFVYINKKVLGQVVYIFVRNTKKYYERRRNFKKRGCESASSGSVHKRYKRIAGSLSPMKAHVRQESSQRKDNLKT